MDALRRKCPWGAGGRATQDAVDEDAGSDLAPLLRVISHRTPMANPRNDGRPGKIVVAAD